MSLARQRWNPRAMLKVCALAAGLLSAGCADPATQTQLNLEFSGLNAAFNRGLSVGGIELEMNFAPTSAMPSQPLRRIVPVGMSDTRMVTVQLPDGAYTLTARVIGRVNCGAGRLPVVVTLGSKTVTGIAVPSTSAMPMRVAIDSQTVSMTPCG
ncbi:MAG: hypothetical protein JNK05_28915 [Myxococcales bacterium]|nr:hypothetical protein [Myxococcales bacterium]